MSTQVVEEFAGVPYVGQDLVAYRAGRVSHAVRMGLPDEEVLQRRRELSGAQMGKWLKKHLGVSVGPTQEQADAICALIQASVA